MVYLASLQDIRIDLKLDLSISCSAAGTVGLSDYWFLLHLSDIPHKYILQQSVLIRMRQEEECEA